MKILIDEFSLDLIKPFSTSFGTLTSRNGFLIKLIDSETGVGESTPLNGWTESLTSCKKSLISARTGILTNSLDSVLKKLESLPAARHGLSLALLDKNSSSAGIPLYQYLGGSHLSSLPVNIPIGDSSLTSTVNQCISAVETGISSLKIKVGKRPLKEDLQRLFSVRNAVGPDIELRADVNGAWSLKQAQIAFKKLEKIDLDYIEQPLKRDDLKGHSQLRNSPINICLDESLISNSLDDIYNMNAADYVILKPMVLGGIDRAYDLAQYARSLGIEPIITTTIDSVIARTAAVHLAASLSPLKPCGIATAHLIKNDLSIDPAPISNGNIKVPQKPGNGAFNDMVEQ
jgi:o-succinylbenzoate synthase